MKISQPPRISQPTRILLALVLGLGAGIASVAAGGAWIEGAIATAEPIGGIWLNALQMTIVPLVVSLLITGIAASAEAREASSARNPRPDPVRGLPGFPR